MSDERAQVAVEQTVALVRGATDEEVMLAALHLAYLAASYLHMRALTDPPGAMLRTAELASDSTLAARLVREHLIGLGSPLQIAEGL